MSGINYIYVFDCPVHGYEHQLLCFRAYREDSKFLWKKFALMPLPMENEDFDNITKWIKEKE